jgi:hypothetical protein
MKSSCGRVSELETSLIEVKTDVREGSRRLEKVEEKM